MTKARALGWYNGWSPEQRRATNPIQQRAYREGVLARPTECSVCGFDQPKRPSDILLHQEDYSFPLQGFGVCRRDHYVLHLRFQHPDRWLRLLQRVAKPDCWAWKLTLDPASQTRPFKETYPSGV